MTKSKPNRKKAAKTVAPSKTASPSKTNGYTPAHEVCKSPKTKKRKVDPPTAAPPVAAPIESAIAPAIGQVTWDSAVKFTRASIEGMDIREIEAQIKGRLPLLDFALGQVITMKQWSLVLAIQIGVLASAGKKKVGRGYFMAWCRTAFPDRTIKTIERYLAAAAAVAPSTPVSKSEQQAISPEETLQSLYHKLGVLVPKPPKKKSAEPKQKAEKTTPATAEDAFTVTDLLARLKSLRVFIEGCTSELPFEKMPASTREELAVEIATLLSLCQQVQASVDEAYEIKSVKGVEILPADTTGAAHPTQEDADES
jgi:hypothetical protein